MGKTPWTPGPWTVGRDKTFGPNGVGVGVIVAACPSHEADANAHLIAAAPDMAEVLDDNVDAIKRILIDLSHHEANDDLRETLNAMLDDTEGVLAKARGDQ